MVAQGSHGGRGLRRNGNTRQQKPSDMVNEMETGPTRIAGLPNCWITRASALVAHWLSNADQSTTKQRDGAVTSILQAIAQPGARSIDGADCPNCTRPNCTRPHTRCTATSRCLLSLPSCTAGSSFTSTSESTCSALQEEDASVRKMRTATTP